MQRKWCPGPADRHCRKGLRVGVPVDRDRASAARGLESSHGDPLNEARPKRATRVVGHETNVNSTLTRRTNATSHLGVGQAGATIRSRIRALR